MKGACPGTPGPRITIVVECSVMFGGPNCVNACPSKESCMSLKTKTNLLACAVACAAGLSAQNVFAHAGFKEALTEGTAATWNAVTVTHGCNTNAGGEGSGVPHKDVVAVSTVFPDFTDTSKVIIRKSGSKVGDDNKAPAAQTSNVGVITPAGTNTVGDETVIPDLSNDIEGATTSVALAASITTDMGGDQMFVNTIPVADAKGTVRGWQSWAGPRPFKGPALLESAKKQDGTDISTTGLSPFRISGIQFKKTSCAKTLRIRVAVANWCDKGGPTFRKPEDNVDVWIGSMTPKFNNAAAMPNASNAIFWPTLTINRNLDKNPLPASGCSNAFDTVYIEPKVEDIDAYLPISAARYPRGAGARYWPGK